MSEIIDLENESQYFKYAGLSKSQIKNWDMYNPMAFWLQSAFNPNKATEEFTDALVLGKLRHMLLLQPELYDKNFQINDELGKSRINVKWKKAQAEVKDKLLISSEELEQVKKMIAAFQYHPLLKSLISGGVIEKPFSWHDKEWDIPCKMRLDYLKNTTEGIYVIDYKTTGKEIPTYIDKESMQYDVGFYARGIKAKYGKDLKKFIFIYQSSSEDEEHLIRIKVVEGPQLEACMISTELAVRQIVPRIKWWQGEYKKGTKTVEEELEKRASLIKCWLPNIEAENWEVSPWFDRYLAESTQKEDIMREGTEGTATSAELEAINGHEETLPQAPAPAEAPAAATPPPVEPPQPAIIQLSPSAFWEQIAPITDELRARVDELVFLLKEARKIIPSKPRGRKPKAEGK